MMPGDIGYFVGVFRNSKNPLLLVIPAQAGIHSSTPMLATWCLTSED
jgi:hypothetical protein